MFEKFMALLLEMFGILIKPKTFSTGSVGYYGVAKLVAADGRRYQITIQAIEIGSKDRAAAAANPPSNPRQ